MLELACSTLRDIGLTISEMITANSLGDPDMKECLELAKVGVGALLAAAVLLNGAANALPLEDEAPEKGAQAPS